MDRLISDQPIRVFFQVVLVTFVSSIALLPIVFVVIFYLRFFSSLGSEASYVKIFVTILTYPSNSTFAPMVAAMAGVFPVVVAGVCYRRLHDRTPVEISAELNHTGYVVFFVLFVGATTSLIALIFLDANSVAFIQYYEETSYNAIKLLFTAILSLQSIYFAQLAGLKPK